ncbi:thioesterase II family protein [Desulfoluna spongiiphila]|uniref:thioesterase II family protein n=1 Tax=Desulfoluna spongiiphila TaxID=419481 RepID=UPI001252E732|nr:alpha/beta fold hydrolase [Desulfoluna spongiiphila]VVS94549.1 alpha/beta hydrolase fold [Desulfoluna spongiiphila]
MTPAHSRSKWFIIKPAARTERVRFFALPFAGGGASIFHGWEGLLPPHVGMYAVQPPGRENRISETPYSSMASLVEGLTEAMLPYLDMPFVLFGHSLGARVAFEVARALRKSLGVEPHHLIVAASRGPHIPEPRPLHHLPDKAFITELERFSGTPKAVLTNPELMALFLPMLRADFTVDETYRFRESPPLSCPITAFGGRSDPEATRDELITWSRYTSSCFTLKMVDGDHFFLLEKKEDLLSKISALIHEEVHLRFPESNASVTAP